MEDTWSAHQQTDARLAGDVAIGSSGIAAGLLVAEAYESYPEIDRFFCNVNHGDSHETKDHRDAEVVQGAGNDLCACHGSHVVYESRA